MKLIPRPKAYEQIRLIEDAFLIYKLNGNMHKGELLKTIEGIINYDKS